MGKYIDNRFSKTCAHYSLLSFLIRKIYLKDILKHFLEEFTMKFAVLLFTLSSLSFGQKLYPLDFDWKDIKSIWESPELKPVLKIISPTSNEPEKFLESRIVGGKIAKPGQFPHSVVLIIDKGWMCAGSILNSYWVLTVIEMLHLIVHKLMRTFQAAHCLFNRTSVDIYSVVNAVNRFSWKSMSTKLVVHEGYDRWFHNDIALVKSLDVIPSNCKF